MDDDIDSDISRWILEFILRQPLNYRLLISLANILHLPNDISSLKKMLLLRTIEFEIAKGCVSENILDLLEQIEELDFQNGIEEQSVLIRDAYCAVAVTCTVNILADNGIVGNYVYSEAVNRIWSGKVPKLEERKVGLISEEFLRWKDDIEAALREESFFHILREGSEGMDAIGAVRAYVDEEKGKMGPSFLELVAHTMKTDDTLRGFLCNAGNAKFGKAGAEVEELPRAADQELGHSNGKTEGHKEIVLPKRKHVAMKRFRGTPAEKSRGVKIADTDNYIDDKSKKCDLPPSSIVDKAQEALKSRKSDLRPASEVDEVQETPESIKCGLAPTPEVDKAEEALKSSKSDLRPTSEVDEVQVALESIKCGLALTPELDKVQEALRSSKHGLPPTPEVDKVLEARTSSKCILRSTPEVDKIQEALKSSKCGLPPTPEIDKVQEALKSSSSELQAVVKDPLPDALLTAEALISITKRGNTRKVPVEESQVRENPPVAESSTAIQANGVHVSSHGQEAKKNAAKPSLLERNSTACTFTWDDSIGGTPEDSLNGSRMQLRTPKRRLVSPLRNYEPPDKLRKRRKIKKWSTEEEDTLRSAVQKYGSGHWKFILNAYRDTFEERTEVDLKDKWRNMTRYIRS